MKPTVSWMFSEKQGGVHASLSTHASCRAEALAPPHTVLLKHGGPSAAQAVTSGLVYDHWLCLVSSCRQAIIQASGTCRMWMPPETKPASSSASLSHSSKKACTSSGLRACPAESPFRVVSA